MTGRTTPGRCPWPAHPTLTRRAASSSICLTRKHCQHLDGEYTGFGQVTEGMDVVEALGATKVDQATGAPKDPPVLLGVKPIE
jgi:cyclophilin family peptidyl-prolyl cis-trans isomerase